MTTTLTAHDTTTAPEHVLTIVEPTGNGDRTLDIAHDVVARGGRASVVMVITHRVDADIREYADSEGLSRGEAEATAIDRLTEYCSERVGGDVPTIVERFGWLGVDIRRHITEDITSVAMPEGLLNSKGIDRLARRIGRPVTVTPRTAA